MLGCIIVYNEVFLGYYINNKRIDHGKTGYLHPHTVYSVLKSLGHNPIMAWIDDEYDLGNGLPEKLEDIPTHHLDFDD